MEIRDFNIMRAIDSIKEKRKVFHSEADFQFALAWEIKRLYPEVDVRLEYAYKVDDKIYHIDILVMIEGKFIATRKSFPFHFNLFLERPQGL